MPSVVLVSAARTPLGRLLGALAPLSAPQLGAIAIREALRRSGLAPADVDECIMGNVVSAGVGQAPARQAALLGGLSDRVSATTVNMVCGSGLKAIMLATQAIAAGDAEVVVAGGMESMSQSPHLLRRLRHGQRMGNAELVDAMIHDGLWCAFEHEHMGLAGERVARESHIARVDQDAFAVRSHLKAAEATAAGRFHSEMVPITVTHATDGSRVIDRDEGVRPDTTVTRLAALTPAFSTDGTITAGNASPVSDGAAAVVLMSETRAARAGLTPMARVAGQASSGLPPKDLLMTPVLAIERVLDRLGWTRESVDLFEINEAFAAQLVAIIAALRLDPATVNVNGGAIALGHPIGASGARILTTLLHALVHRQLRRGIAALCLGGGNGVALAIER